MTDSWYFDLHGPNKDIWVWIRVAPDGKMIARCDRTFRYYLEVLEDAQQHGFTGEPKFGEPPPPVSVVKP